MTGVGRILSKSEQKLVVGGLDTQCFVCVAPVGRLENYLCQSWGCHVDCEPGTCYYCTYPCASSCSTFGGGCV